MTDLKNDMEKIQTLIGNAFTATGSLVALANGGVTSPEKLQRNLEQTASEFEKAVLELRILCETHSPGVGGYGKRPILLPQQITGHTGQLGDGWLHIQINTLLPHCRFQTPMWFSDTIRRLLDDYESGGSQIPFFRDRALLVIEEYSDINGRRIFDQDNKGYKAVCNALKGRAIPDDDQYTLGVCLLSNRSSENVCHITLLDARDASDFFALHSGDYALGDIYEDL